MRCPDCNKFVAYDEPEAELNQVDISGSTVTSDVRVVLKCADCGTELKDFELNGEATVDHDCSKKKDFDKKVEAGEEVFEIESEGEPEAESRTQTTDRRGKPIKNPRYMKTFYGFKLDTEVKCLCCGETETVETTAEEQASGGNELT